MFRNILFLCVLIFSSAKIMYCNERENNYLRYIENNGQWEKNILYKTNFRNGYSFLERAGLVFVIKENKDFHNHGIDNNSSENLVKKHAFKLELINSNSNPKISPEVKSQHYYNYFIGNIKSKWKSNIHDYKIINYSEIYDNIDWKIYSENENIKHDFIIKKGGEVEDISLRYIGIDKLRVEEENLVLYTNIGKVMELKPIAFQIINNKKIYISAKFQLSKDKVITYKIGDYNKDYDLVIDPQLIFSTYSGSYSDNWGFSATYDRKGYAYLGGIVCGDQYPTTIGAFDEIYNGGSWDISITKFSPDGKTMIFSTYLGSSTAEMPHSMIVNEFGELIVFGTTGGPNFPITPNAYQKTFKGGTYLKYANSLEFPNGVDIFVSKFNSSGTTLMGSTYIGGSDNDGINFVQRLNSNYGVIMNGNDSLYSNYGDGARGEIITDDQNNIYVGSCTYSNDFPITKNAFQPNFGGIQDGIVFKLDYSLSNLLFSSYIGGSQEDAVYSVDTDSEYKLYVTGGTVSHNFPITQGAYNTKFNGGSCDGFLSLISYNGSNLIASTYYGSNKYDQSYFVRTDKKNNPHIFGQTKASGNTLIYNAKYNIPNSGQFITKFNPDLSSRIWSTVFGNGNGKKNISPSAFTVDICGRIYTSGWGSFGELSTNNFETTPNAYQATTDNKDFYIMCIDGDASYLDYGTYFGEYSMGYNATDHVDGGTSRFDKYSTLYQTICAGCGGSDNFPTTPNAYSNVNNSNNCNAAMVKFNINNDFPVADFDYPQIGCAPTTINFTNNSRGNSYFWNFGDGNTSTSQNPSHTYTIGGLYDVMLIAYMPGGCVESDTSVQTLIILENGSHYLPDIYTCENIPIQIGIDPLPSNNVSFKWHPSGLVTDSTITNPLAIISSDTQFKLIVTDGLCIDTIIQNVIIDYIDIDIPDTISTCNSPYKIEVNYNNSDSIKISDIRDFSNILNQNLLIGKANIILSKSQYIYVSIYEEGCYGMDSLWINYYGLDVKLNIKEVKCAGDNNGEASADVSQGTPPYNFIWSNGVTGIGKNSINNLIPGDYTLSIIDAEGCESYLEFNIFSPDTLRVSISKTDNNCLICSGRINLNPFGGNSPYNILWSDGKTDLEIKDLCKGKYTVRVTDSNTCKIDTSINIDNLDIFYDFWVKASETKIYAGKEITLMAKPITNISYQWQPTNVDKPNEHTTTARPEKTTTYYVFATDNKGCDIRGSVKIDVEEIICGKPNIFVPNIFTPNGDGKNDYLRIEGEFITSIYLVIFDRWGEVVFSSRDINNLWDGKHKGVDCLQGVYYYRLEIDCMKGGSYSTSGDITLIR